MEFNDRIENAGEIIDHKSDELASGILHARTTERSNETPVQKELRINGESPLELGLRFALKAAVLQKEIKPEGPEKSEDRMYNQYDEVRQEGATAALAEVMKQAFLTEVDPDRGGDEFRDTFRNEHLALLRLPVNMVMLQDEVMLKVNNKLQNQAKG